MDFRHDRRLLHCHVFRASICDSHRYGDPDCVFQRSHCYCKRSKQGQKSTIHKVAELVLFGDYNVLSLWRECNILLQAYCAGGQGLATFRNTPPLHQLYALRHWFCLLCWLSPERPLPFPIHSIRLDAYGPLSDRRASSFHHEQHFRGDDLVLPPSILGYHQRHFRLHLRNCLRSYSAHQAFT